MKIIISHGDINGIGLEILFKALKNENFPNVEFSIAGNRETIERYWNWLGYKFESRKDGFQIGEVFLELIETQTKGEIRFGETQALSGQLSIESLETATSLVLCKEKDAIITMPISKKSMKLAGWEFLGHTEYFGSFFPNNNELMILYANNFRVALATIHEPIREIHRLISRELISERAIAFYNSLKNDFAIKSPKIAILSLNPHAGEMGEIGDEEIKIINPAIEKANQKTGSACYGPFASDGFFARGMEKSYDGVLAMYHDQGLIPLKIAAGEGGANFTANLPIVRISPDHGVAFEIAGKGIASEKSAIDAIKGAIEIFNNRKLLKKV